MKGFGMHLANRMASPQGQLVTTISLYRFNKNLTNTTVSREEKWKL